MSGSQYIFSMLPRQVRVTEVEPALEAMWESLRSGLESEGTVTRACMSNLLIYCQDYAQVFNVRADLPSILQDHPCRVLLLCGQEEVGENLMEAGVCVHYYAAGESLQVCGEEIGVASSVDAEERLPSVARSLLVGDLPTALWWASDQPPAEAGPLFQGLLAISAQVIYDSVAWVDPNRGMVAMADWIAADGGKHVSCNLAWLHLKPWRKLVGEMLDPPASPGALSFPRRLNIEHGPHALPMVCLLIGWLADCLRWRPVAVNANANYPSELVWSFEGGAGPLQIHVRSRSEGEPLIYRLEWLWGGEHSGEALFQAQDNRRLEVRTSQVTGLVHSIVTPGDERAVLVSEQLALRGRDRSFERALTLAGLMSRQFHS